MSNRENVCARVHFVSFFMISGSEWGCVTQVTQMGGFQT